MHSTAPTTPVHNKSIASWYSKAQHPGMQKHSIRIIRRAQKNSTHNIHPTTNSTPPPAPFPPSSTAHSTQYHSTTAHNTQQHPCLASIGVPEYALLTSCRSLDANQRPDPHSNLHRSHGPNGRSQSFAGGRGRVGRVQIFAASHCLLVWWPVAPTRTEM